MESNIKIAIVIPWRAKADRVKGFNFVTEWYKNNLPNSEIILADSKDKPFSLSGSRNIGVLSAKEMGADVVVINDADTIPQKDALMEAVFDCMNDNLVHLPYNQYKSLQIEGSKQLLRGLPAEQCHYFEVPGACSGVYVCTPDTWFSHYGQDERFRGWGFEDAAWWSAHKTILGHEPVRHEGSVYSLTHKSEVKEGPQYEANAALCYKYLQAESNKDEMIALASQGLRHTS
jgi:cellulose synthase/poly-beta-1,6-N-acetylglucosamine synthase-like glycosyltransferase